MRIAFDTFNLAVAAGSGNKTYTAELIQALSDLNAGFSLLCTTYWRKEKACRAILGDHPARRITGRFPHPRLLGNTVTFPLRAITFLSEQILARECDLFHCTNPSQFPFSMPRVATTICDLIALRDEPWTSEGSRRFYRKHLDAIVKRSIHLFSISEFTKKELCDRYPSLASRITVTPLAAHPRFAPLPPDRSFLRKFGIRDSDRPYLLYVGDIQPRKNLSATVKAFESLDARFNDIGFIIVGQARSRLLSEPILRDIAASPKRERITVLHTVSDNDLVHFYNHAIGFVFFSHFEGFGLPVIEAMQCGCPVATAANSSLKEIADGAAVLADANSLDSLCDSMTQLLENQTLRDTLRKKGLERASQFSWKKTAETTAAVYQRIQGTI